MADGKRYSIPLADLTTALDQPLALIDDDARRTQIRNYLQLVRVHLERAVLDVLSEAARSVNESGGNVEARVQYGSGAAEWVVDRKGSDPEEAGWFAAGDHEKVTIRIPAELKQLMGARAVRSGVSLNTCYIRTLAAALGGVEGERSEGIEPEGHRSGRRLKGIIGR